MAVLIYFSVCIIGFGIMLWIMFYSLKNPKFPPNNNDDDGGLPRGGDLPIIDLPPSGKIEDLLTDRWFETSHQRKN
jgi:hypothetical protein